MSQDVQSVEFGGSRDRDAEVPDRFANDGSIAVCTWESTWSESIDAAERLLTEGGRPRLLRLARQPYPDDVAWQRLNSLHLFILSVPNWLGEPGTSSEDIQHELQSALHDRAVLRASHAATPKVTPLPESERPRPSMLRATPEEREALLASLYASGTDEGMR